MTILELEKILDMPRATIRYYEREGLLSPLRAENGYREYTPEDAQALERIRLLRALDCSVAEIREIKEGRADMAAVLRAKGADAERAMSEKASVREICEDICRSGRQFDDLDAKKYLSGAWRDQQPPKPVEPPKEILPKVNPWRRFWARMLDWQIYTGLWTILISFISPSAHLSENSLWTFVQIAIGDLVLFALEPLFLHFFGTTPGKWALGLRVEADMGGRLTLRQARERTASVLLHGLCLHIPVLEIRALWKRYHDAQDGVPLDWESESVLVQKGRGSVPGYIALRALIALVLVCCMGLGRMPSNRGALTPEQFAENYNHLVWAYGLQARHIDANGEWIDPAEQEGVVVIVFGDDEERLPGIDLDVQDGIVQGLSLSMRAEAGEDGNMVFMPTGEMSRAAAALCCADSPRWREMVLLGSAEMKIMQFCENLDPIGRETAVEDIEGISLRLTDDGSERVQRAQLEIGGWIVEYVARSEGGVYATGDGSAVFLPEAEDGAFAMEFTVRRK